LPDRLGRLIPKVQPLLRRDIDDRAIADGLGLSRGDVEAILRYVQHAPVDYAEAGDDLLQDASSPRKRTLLDLNLRSAPAMVIIHHIIAVRIAFADSRIYAGFRLILTLVAVRASYLFFQGSTMRIPPPSITFALALTAALSVGLLTPRAQADPVLITSDSNGSGAGISATTLGQQFTLNQAATITSVTASLSGGGSLSSASMTIDQDNGGVLGASTGNTSTNSVTGALGSSFTDTSFSFSSATLAAGTYWMVLDPPPAAYIWQTQTTGQTNSSSYGTINPNLDNDGIYASGTLLMALSGTPSVVPEPSSLVLCGLAGAIASAYTWRRRRRALLA
jgi:hypothetical protein